VKGIISTFETLPLTDVEQHMVVDGTFRVSLYKALLFIKIAEAIKAGTLNLTHSYKYRSLDEYLIPKAAWQANRTDYLTRAALTEAADWDRMVQRWATVCVHRGPSSYEFANPR
jgi:hypothetical protein